MAALVPRAASPWALEPDDLARRLGTDLTGGLSPGEAADRLALVGPNRLDEAPTVPPWRRVLAQFAQPLVYLLLAAVAISLVTWLVEGADSVPYDAIVILAILVGNAVLGHLQEARAEQAVAALQAMTAVTCTVVRDGHPVEVPSAEVVPGDLLLLREGDAVAADGRLVETAALTVGEAALTGESEPARKDPATLGLDVALADRANLVFGGTAVMAGRGRAVVTATGMATEVGRIAALLEATTDAPTPLQREIHAVGRTLAVAVVAIAVVVVAAILLTSEVDRAADAVDVLLVGVSLAVAAVPEGLPAILSVVLALGVQRMAREHAIVKRLSAVEALGSASVICSDKTGTLTRNEMTLRRILTHSGSVEITGTGYRPDGELVADGAPLGPGPVRAEAELVLAAGALAGDASLRRHDGAWLIAGDPTEAAFLVAERKAGIADRRDGRFRRVAEVPFTSERRLMTTVQVDGTDDRVGVVTKGAPDVLLARCTHEQVGDHTEPLTARRREAVLAGVELLAGQGYRTLGVARRALPEGVPETTTDVEHDLVLAGVVGIIDPPRAEARAAVEEAHRAGLRVLLITGDHPRTAERIAADLTIAPEGCRARTGPELDDLDDEALRGVVRSTTVFARATPEHKLRIVEALQGDGHLVAVTGDGVNDAPALKTADIGIAMGITGTDVAKEAADLVLADDDFATIVLAVREGRGIFADIRRFLRYLLSSNAGEVLTMFLGVVFAGLIGLDAAEGLAVPLLATQILWINLLTDAAPALALGVDPPPEDVMDRPPRDPADRVIDAPMWRGFAAVGLVMAVTTLLTLDLNLPGGLVEGSEGLTHARTAAFTTLVLAQLFNCFNARSDHRSALHRLFTNRLLWGAVALSLVLQVAVVHLPVLNRAFDTTSLGLTDWLVCTALASVVLWSEELRKLVARRRSRRQSLANASS